MTRREKQYFDWKNFWRKRKPPVVKILEVGGEKIRQVTFESGGSIRVPYAMLKKMGLDKNGKPIKPV